MNLLKSIALTLSPIRRLLADRDRLRTENAELLAQLQTAREAYADQVCCTQPAAHYIAMLKAGCPEAGRVDWERTVENAYRALVGPGRNIIDIGGHRARHAAIFAGDLAAANLVVIEPLAEQFAYLAGLFANKPGIRLINAAVGKAPGTASFVINRNAPEESGLKRRIYNNESTANIIETTVDVITLDSLDLDFKVDYIKIDVEGGELDILRGAHALLQRDRPLMSVEYGYPSYSAYGHQPGDLYDIAAENNYVLADMFGNIYRDRAEWLVCVDAYYWDYLMIPQEQVALHLTALLHLRRLGIPMLK